MAPSIHLKDTTLVIWHSSARPLKVNISCDTRHQVAFESQFKVPNNTWSLRESGYCVFKSPGPSYACSPHIDCSVTAGEGDLGPDLPTKGLGMPDPPDLLWAWGGPRVWNPQVLKFLIRSPQFVTQLGS